MIEKLDDIKHTEFLYDKKGFITKVADGGVIISKINEIIELLNAIVVDVDGTKCIDGSKKAEPEPADPYAEPIKTPCKRKLKEITFEDDWYKEKEIEIEFIPDDDIIYKGGNND